MLGVDIGGWLPPTIGGGGGGGWRDLPGANFEFGALLKTHFGAF